MSFVVEGKSRNDIRKVAMLCRKLQNAENELYFPILDFVEKTLPSIIPNFSFRVGTMEEMGECHGLTLPGKNEIVIREDVYDRAYAGSGRDRLTVAHELYHYIEHSSATVGFARTSKHELPKYMDPEWQADAFGGELLVASHLAKKLTVSEIAEKCGVSVAAARTQYRVMH